MLIFPDADLEQAVNGVAFATFVATGQTCIMGARLLVHKSIYDEFVVLLLDTKYYSVYGNANLLLMWMDFPFNSERLPTRLEAFVWAILPR